MDERVTALVCALVVVTATAPIGVVQGQQQGVAESDFRQGALATDRSTANATDRSTANATVRTCAPTTLTMLESPAYTHSNGVTYAVSVDTPLGKYNSLLGERTNHSATGGNSSIDLNLSAQADGGAGAVGAAGTGHFVSEGWQPEHNDTYVVEAVYRLNGSVDQERNPGWFENHASRVAAQSQVFVRSGGSGGAERVLSNETEYDTIIPTLSELGNDAVINAVQLVVDKLLGFGGEIVTEVAGLSREGTSAGETFDNGTVRHVGSTVNVTTNRTYAFGYRFRSALLVAAIGEDDPFTYEGGRASSDVESSLEGIRVERVRPLAETGNDSVVTAGSNVTLDGSGSCTPVGDLDVSWEQSGGPSVTLQNATTTTPTFTAPSVSEPATLAFVVTVTDDRGVTDSDTVNVTVEPAERANGNDSSGPSGLRVDHPTTVAPEGQATITVSAVEAGDISVSGDLEGWTVESTDPATITTFPNPSDTPYVTGSDEAWGHVFSSAGNNSFELVVTAPNATGTYDLTAEATASGSTVSENFTVEVAAVHESGVSQRTFEAATGGDGTLERSDLLNVVATYIRGEPLDGVSITRSDVLDLVRYYLV